MARQSLAIYPTAEPFIPKTLSLPAMQKASKGCRGCDLYQVGTQTVFGEGAEGARVMFVGKQPGDQEDRAGKPFVGPSGAMLEKVGIDRSEVYVTNAVKHFKWEPRGKRRLHVKPNSREIAACKPWLKAEVEVVRPAIIVALGATAAQAILGKEFRVTQRRGEVIRDTTWATAVIATVHPSSLLRAPDEAARREAIARFEADMRVVKKAMDELNGAKRTSRQAARRADDANPGADAREPQKKENRGSRKQMASRRI